MFKLLATIALAACASALPAPQAPNLVELAASVPDLSTLVAAVKAGGLVDTLEGPGPFTVFAPTNEAFAALPDGVLKKLLEPENKPMLDKVLTYHVVAAEAKSTDLKNDEKIKTVEGENVTVNIIGGHVLIHGAAMKNVARVTSADNMASNGVAHIIDEVLIPASLITELLGAEYANPNIIELALSVPTLSTLVTAIKAAGLVDALSGPGPFTVFAPTNEAFKVLPAGVLEALLQPGNKGLLTEILTYHVLSGLAKSSDLKNQGKYKTIEGTNITSIITPQHVYIEGNVRGDFAQVTSADNMASNGIVHIINEILLPKALPALTTSAPTLPNIVMLAESVPDLSVLVSALKAANVVDGLEGPGPFTVFAPTNEAFGKLPTGVLDKLLLPGNKDLLQEILAYHVVEGENRAADLRNNQRIKTIEGGVVTVYINSGHVSIRGNVTGDLANVTSADNFASNGVVHIINEILLPFPVASKLTTPAPALPNIVDLAVSVSELSVLVTALKAADLVEFLEGKGPFTVFAPTNSAFSALPADVQKKLFEPAYKMILQSVLAYHVVSGEARKHDLKNGEHIKTLEGSEVTAIVGGWGRLAIEGKVPHNDANVTSADNFASNGVVHIINKVLLPYPILEKLIAKVEALL
eukprot:m.334650 g.334650  ORF g.334650 m.334650 type:complete len:640 (+) comp17405_c0_seq1:123-2042(+)